MLESDVTSEKWTALLRRFGATERHFNNYESTWPTGEPSQCRPDQFAKAVQASSSQLLRYLRQTEYKLRCGRRCRPADQAAKIVRVVVQRSQNKNSRTC